MYNPQKTADNIKSILNQKGITVKRLCEMVETNKNLITKINTGDITNIKVFCQIAHVLNVSLDDIIDNSKPYELK